MGSEPLQKPGGLCQGRAVFLVGMITKQWFNHVESIKWDLNMASKYGFSFAKKYVGSPRPTGDLCHKQLCSQPAMTTLVAKDQTYINVTMTWRKLRFAQGARIYTYVFIYILRYVYGTCIYIYVCNYLYMYVYNIYIYAHTYIQCNTICVSMENKQTSK